MVWVWENGITVVSLSPSGVLQRYSRYTRLQKEQADDISDMLMKVCTTHSHSQAVRPDLLFHQTFQQRLVDVMDQAQHFGGSANMMGSGSRSGDPGAEFREGLEARERERQSYSIHGIRTHSADPPNPPKVFTIAQESTTRTKQWYESTDKRR